MIFLLVIALEKISNAAYIGPKDRYFVVVRMLSFQLTLLLVCFVLSIYSS